MAARAGELSLPCHYWKAATTGFQPWQSLRSLSLSPRTSSPLQGDLELLTQGVQSRCILPPIPNPSCFSFFSSSPSLWVLLAPRNCGAASPVPIQPGVRIPPFPALELLWKETARAGGHHRATPCPAPGEGWALHSQECFAAGFLLSEPCECVCLLRSKLKKKKTRKKKPKKNHKYLNIF